MGKPDRDETRDLSVEIKGERLGKVKTRKVVEIGDSSYVNYPRKSLLRKAASFGMTIADFVLNYELCITEVIPEGGGLADSVTILSWRRRGS